MNKITVSKLGKLTQFGFLKVSQSRKQIMFFSIAPQKIKILSQLLRPLIIGYM